MKTYLISLWAALALCAGAGQTIAAPAPAPAPSATLAVVVVDSLRSAQQSYYNYNLIAEVFGDVFNAQKWPLNVTFERFAANTEDHPLELRIYYKGITNEFGEKVYRAWTILYVNGAKHDFGIVEYRNLPRPGRQMDDVIRDVFRGAAQKTVGLIAPYIAPAPAPAPATR